MSDTLAKKFRRSKYSCRQFWRKSQVLRDNVHLYLYGRSRPSIADSRTWALEASLTYLRMLDPESSPREVRKLQPSILDYHRQLEQTEASSDDADECPLWQALYCAGFDLFVEIGETHRLMHDELHIPSQQPLHEKSHRAMAMVGSIVYRPWIDWHDVNDAEIPVVY